MDLRYSTPKSRPTCTLKRNKFVFSMSSISYTVLLLGPRYRVFSSSRRSYPPSRSLRVPLPRPRRKKKTEDRRVTFT